MIKSFVLSFSFRFKMDFETITLDSDEEEEVVKVEGGTIEFLGTFPPSKAKEWAVEFHQQIGEYLYIYYLFLFFYLFLFLTFLINFSKFSGVKVHLGGGVKEASVKEVDDYILAEVEAAGIAAIQMVAKMREEKKKKIEKEKKEQEKGRIKVEIAEKEEMRKRAREEDKRLAKEWSEVAEEHVAGEEFTRDMATLVGNTETTVAGVSWNGNE